MKPTKPTPLKLLLGSKIDAQKGATGDLFDGLHPTSSIEQIIEPSLILEVMQPPVVFHKIFVDISGGVLPALLLSHLTILREAEPDAEWLILVEAACRESTGLSKFELQTARRSLKEKKLIDERKDGAKRILVKVDAPRIMLAIKSLAQKRWGSTDLSAVGGIN